MLRLLFVALLFAEIVKNAAMYIGNHPETVEELLSDRTLRPLVEGDLLMLWDSNTIGAPWPTRSIPYEISSEIKDRTGDILAAMAMISKDTCISFHKRNNEPDYLFFNISNGCASYVGFSGGQQAVFVAPSCTVGNIAHELLHSLGFQHEHTRWDRDQFISVIEGNIIPAMRKNFQKLDGKTFQIPYDYASIMHYGGYFFSSNGKPTIIPKKDAKDMGQRRRLMQSDIERVRDYYRCDSLKTKTKVGS